MFVFLSQSFHRRSEAHPYGDQTQPKVRVANQIVVNLVTLLCVAASRNVFYVLLS